MPAAVWIAAAMVVARITLIRGAQALDGIVIVARGAAVVAAAGAVKLRTQILCGSGSFRPALHAYAAGTYQVTVDVELWGLPNRTLTESVRVAPP